MRENVIKNKLWLIIWLGFVSNANTSALFSRNAHGPITGLQKPSKTPYNKQLINLERSVFTGKSQTSALPY